MADDVVRRTVTIPVPLHRAFALFTEQLAAWWPSAYTFGEENFATAIIEPRQGGRWFERDRNGRETDWGRVLLWEPPHRVVLSWAISPHRVPERDPARASEVDVRFVPESATTTHVDLEHRHFGRHGEGAETMRAGMDSSEGWSKLLNHFAGAMGGVRRAPAGPRPAPRRARPRP